MRALHLDDRRHGRLVQTRRLPLRGLRLDQGIGLRFTGLRVAPGGRRRRGLVTRLRGRLRALGRIRRDRRLRRCGLTRHGQRRHARRGDTRLRGTRQSLFALATLLRGGDTGLARARRGAGARLILVVLHTRLTRSGLRSALVLVRTRLRRRRRRRRRRGRLIGRNGPRRRRENGHGRSSRKRQRSARHRPARPVRLTMFHYSPNPFPRCGATCGPRPVLSHPRHELQRVTRMGRSLSESERTNPPAPNLATARRSHLCLGSEPYSSSSGNVTKTHHRQEHSGVKHE